MTNRIAICNRKLIDLCNYAEGSRRRESDSVVGLEYEFFLWKLPAAELEFFEREGFKIFCIEKFSEESLLAMRLEVATK